MKTSIPFLSAVLLGASTAAPLWGQAGHYEPPPVYEPTPSGGRYVPGGGYSSWGGGGGSSDAGWIIPVLLVGFLVVGGVVLAGATAARRRKLADQDASPSTGDRRSGRASAPERVRSNRLRVALPSPHELALQAAQTQRALEELARQDPWADPSCVREFISASFLRIQKAWEARDYGPVQELLTYELLGEHLALLHSMRQHQEINRLENLRLDNVELIDVQPATAAQDVQVTALITFRTGSYFVHERSLRWVRGDRTTTRFQEFWTFRRQGAAWVLCRIDQTREANAVPERRRQPDFATPPGKRWDSRDVESPRKESALVRLVRAVGRGLAALPRQGRRMAVGCWRFMARPWRLAGLAVLALLVVGGFVLAHMHAVAQSQEHLDRGRLAFQQGDYDKAVAEYTDALACLRRADAYRERAAAYNKTRRWDEAVADATAALQLEPGDAATLLSRADALENRGVDRDQWADFDRAIADADQALRLHANLVLAHVYRGRASCDKRDYDQGLVEGDAAVQLDAHEVRAYILRGTASYGKGDRDRALADYDEAIRIDPQNAEAHSQRGTYWAEKGDYDQARDEYNRAIELNPHDPWPYQERGVVFERLKDEDRALADYDQAVAVDPKNVPAYAARAYCQFVRRADAKAFADCQSALALNAGSSLACTMRGLGHLDRGETRQARRDFDEAVRLNPNDPDAHLARARWAGATDKVEAAVADCTRAAELDRRDLPAALAYRAESRFYQGDFDQAAADCDKALEADPRCLEAYVVRSLAHAKKGESDKAAADFDQAVRIDRQDAFSFRGDLQIRGDPEAAVLDYTEAIRLAPRRPETYVQRAQAYSDLKRHDEALADLGAAIQIDAAYAYAYLERARIFQDDKAWDRCIAEAAQAIERDPTLAQAFVLRGAARVERQDDDGAIADCTRAVELDPEDPAALVLRGSIYGNKGRNAEAVSDCTAALRLDDGDAWAYATRGLAYWNMQQDAQARADLDKAVKIDPQYADLRAKMN